MKDAINAILEAKNASARIKILENAADKALNLKPRVDKMVDDKNTLNKNLTNWNASIEGLIHEVNKIVCNLSVR